MGRNTIDNFVLGAVSDGARTRAAVWEALLESPLYLGDAAGPMPSQLFENGERLS